MLLPFIGFLFFFVGQMPSMIAGLPAPASLSTNSKQFDEDPFLAALHDFAKIDNKTRTSFEKMTEIGEKLENCAKQRNCSNEAMLKEAKAIGNEMFDVADKNKDEQVDGDEMAQFVIEFLVYSSELRWKMLINGKQNFTKSEQRDMLISLSLLKGNTKMCGQKMIKELDKDGDEKLSRKEMEEFTKEGLKEIEFGRNGRGKRQTQMMDKWMEKLNINVVRDDRLEW